MTWQIILSWVVIVFFSIFVVLPIIGAGRGTYLDAIKCGAIVAVFMAIAAVLIGVLLWALHTVGMF